MNYVERPQGGSCQNEENTALFTSEYLEPFDTEEYKDFNPQATSKQIAQEQFEHGLKNAEATLNAKRICLQCPLLDTCTIWVMNQDVPVFGVVAAMTEEERSHLKNDVSIVSSEHILSAPETQEIRAMALNFRI